MVAALWHAHGSVAILDMDHFKYVNDTFLATTSVTRCQEVTRTIQANIREVDVFGRLGARNSVQILPGVQPCHAAEMLNRLRMVINQLDFRPHQGPASVSASIGMATFTGDHASFDSLLEQADRRL
ncbi:MAG: GGDEF domain-containing protein [Gammaproteobacteria bacterium]